MNLLNLFLKKDKQEEQVGGIEDFMYLIRVYYQATMCSQLGISNLAALPDLRTFKQSLKVPTVNNRLGQGEKKRSQQMLSQMYNLKDGFFKEIDQSIKKKCRTIQDVQPYFLLFQDFSQHLMMSVGELMQWKLRLPAIFQGALRRMSAQSVSKILNNQVQDSPALRQSTAAVRKAVNRLGYSESWVQDYATTLILLAKKAPKKQLED